MGLASGLNHDKYTCTCMYTCTEYMCTVHVHIYMYMCVCSSFLHCTHNIIHVSVMYTYIVHVLLRGQLFCNGWKGVVYIRGQYTRLGEEVRVRLVSDQNHEKPG